MRLSDEDAAYAAAQWASGIKQREIAHSFGYKGAAPICIAIEQFLRKFTPDAEINEYPRTLAKGGAARRAMVLAALEQFKTRRSSSLEAA